MNTNISFSTADLNEDSTAIIASFSGQLDETTCDKTFEQLKDFLKKNPEERFFILQLKDLKYINSKSIGYIIDAYRKISNREGRLVLCHVPENILDTLDIVGINRIIEISKDIESAKVALLESV